MAPHEITTRPADARIRVEVDGAVVAESDDAIALEETGLRTRYYLPLGDIREDLLRPSDSTSRCPWKGDASYYSLDGHPDVMWFYPEPKEDVADIRGRVSFYNEKVDLFVDGEREA